VFKRLLGQIVVVGLALSLVTACSSGSSVGKEDCKLLLEAEDLFSADYESLTKEDQATQAYVYISQLYIIQPLLQEPELQEFVNNFLKEAETGEIGGRTYSPESNIYLKHVKRFPRIMRDFYCESL